MMFHLGSILWIILIGIVVYLALTRHHNEGCGCKIGPKDEAQQPPCHDESTKKLGL